MEKSNFSVANTTYLLTAISMINEDPVKAKILLRLDNETLDTLKKLSAEDIRLLGNIKTPLMSIKIDSGFMEEMKKICDSQLTSDINKFSNKLMLKAS